MAVRFFHPVVREYIFDNKCWSPVHLNQKAFQFCDLLVMLKLFLFFFLADIFQLILSLKNQRVIHRV